MAIRAIRLGAEVHGRGSRQARPYRIHTRGPARVARQRGERERPRTHALRGARPGDAVPNASHTADRYRAILRRRPIAMERPNTGLRRTRGEIRLSETWDPAVRRPTVFRA